MDYRKADAKAAARAQFRGLWAAITTPFTPEGEVDEPGLRHNMRHYTDTLHIEGIFCTGVMGEFWALTSEERRRIVEIVVEEARGKCRVIAHTGHTSAHEALSLTRHAQDVGADFAVILNPYYPPAPEAGLYDWFAFVAQRVEIGIWLFDTSYAAYELSPRLIDRLADLPNICGIKLARPLERYRAVKEQCADRLVLSHPSEPLWLSLIRDHGQQVHMSSPAPYLFQTKDRLPLREYTELALNGQFPAAEAIARDLEPARELNEQWVQLKWQRERIAPIAAIKAWSELMGMAAGPVRPPLVPLSEAEHARLRAELAGAGLLDARLVSA
ncbi:MAG: dihydrodipicolinate synthase family protein [Chloroflexi bacterium]|nr:dihydrodipicolinate synthase family protein [Chloroflexota bacterium]